MNINFGVDYYPEHWEKERWEQDARLMSDMGVDVVRLGEFSWMKMEPEKGQFHFEWLDEAVNLLGDYGIKSIIGTPTAAPPAWIIAETPDILPVDRDGIRKGFGGRHHDCQSNQIYRSHIKRLVTAMARHFSANQNVIGWQIDNELGNSHENLCYCNSCKKNYQIWLQKKYGRIDKLNSAWGTEFWSQGYNDFAQINTPIKTVTGENPASMLDWKLFCSDLIVDFQQYQIDIIRKICPHHFITHNFMGFADKVDYFKLAKSLDFISHDQYPYGRDLDSVKQENYVLAAALDLMRGTKKKPFWIMEQQSGITGWDTMGRSPSPGQLALWAQQAIAHGADTVLFFRWRTCAVGTEQFWHGVLPHSGIPGRRYDELRTMIKQMKPIMNEFKGSMPKNEVAIIFSYRQDYAFQIQPHHPKLSYIDQILKYYKALYEHNRQVDFIKDDDDFSAYKLVVAPLQYIMTPELEDRFFNYVKNGGNLILTMRCGVKDTNNNCMTDRKLPGRLSELTGIVISDYDCLLDTNVKMKYGTEYFEGSKWSDIIDLIGAEAIAEYDSEFYKGTPCVTKNKYGDGDAYYIGTEPDDKFLKILMGNIISSIGLKPTIENINGLEVTTRFKDGKEWLFILNHTSENKKYSVPLEYSLRVGKERGFIAAYEVQIYDKCEQL